ncbi:hypothetical protein SHL15_5684 [Streptomyces hygroscopicus subsp. limoneus]|nr:hypothetical protein SHL15_5684 [Streptomyces hygroscopicus subsp. limoneus]
MRTALRKRPISPASAAGCPLSTAGNRIPARQGSLQHSVGGGA